MSKGFFIDTTRCTACRGCQVACKQWNQNPAVPTENTGSHQNPPDVDFNTYKLVRMEEHVVDGKFEWLFFPDQCRHCVAPPCKATADLDVEDSVIHDEATGAVVFTEKTKDLEDPEAVIESCPYDIPRQAAGSNQLGKCTMCMDRIQNGLKPACVTACPVGAMNFGTFDEMMAMGKERLAAVQKEYPNAALLDPDDVIVIFLVAHDPKLYHEFAIADAGSQQKLTRKQMLAQLGSPLRRSGKRLFG